MPADNDSQSFVRRKHGATACVLRERCERSVHWAWRPLRRIPYSSIVLALLHRAKLRQVYSSRCDHTSRSLRCMEVWLLGILHSDVLDGARSVRNLSVIISRLMCTDLMDTVMGNLMLASSVFRSVGMLRRLRNLSVLLFLPVLFYQRVSCLQISSNLRTKIVSRCQEPTTHPDFSRL